ncbi:MAG: Sortase family protein [Nocardioides sp.]|nr:Sortase family protein [Nocardioides sp.]
MVLLLAGVACLIMWSAWSSPGPSNGAAPETEPRSPASTSAGTGRHEPAAAPAPARPVALTIPAIAVRSTLEGLAMNGDGTVEVPQHPGNAGWYRLGTRPGAQGSAVILGHVDSVRGPAVFYRLATLHRGNLVNVRLADGSSVRFRVRSVRLYPNARFPAEKVYAARGGRFLNLVTCGGEYDASRGGYQANVVVNARWVSTSAS